MFEILRDILAVLGGAGIIILALWKILGGIWQDRLKEKARQETEEKLEVKRQEYGVRRVQTDRFANSEYDVYINLWQNLQALDLAVDTLWHKVTENNILSLAKQTRKTEPQIKNWPLFFEDQHLERLKKLFETLNMFHAGKKRLANIRSKNDVRSHGKEEIEYQIGKNREHREEWKNLMTELRHSFRNKLSEIEN